jgi:hypothetical protein
MVPQQPRLALGSSPVYALCPATRSMRLSGTSQISATNK